MALRTLENTGLMPVLFAEWSAIEHLAIPDPEYRYTLDEHTLRTIECVNELGSASTPERRRFAALLSEIDDPTLVLFALLYHETGRGGEDPLALAAERAGSAMARIRMPDEARSAGGIPDPASVRSFRRGRRARHGRPGYRAPPGRAGGNHRAVESAGGHDVRQNRGPRRGGQAAVAPGTVVARLRRGPAEPRH